MTIAVVSLYFQKILLGQLGKPVVVGHGSRLQGLGCVPVHQGTAPVVLPVVPRVGHVDDVVTGHAERRRVAVRLHVEVNAHVEGVCTLEAGHLQLRAQLGVSWEESGGGKLGRKSQFCSVIKTL